MTAQDLVLAGSYDYRLVAVSIAIAVTASYTALDLAGRVTAARAWARLWWLMGGAAAMGIGIWSMHYTGMLAFSLPVPIQYDWPTVLLSLLAGILSSGFALLVVSRRKMGGPRARGRQHFYGRGDCGSALHRHGGDAPVGKVPLFSLARDSFGGTGDRVFFDRPRAGVSFSGRTHRP